MGLCVTLNSVISFKNNKSPAMERMENEPETLLWKVSTVLWDDGIRGQGQDREEGSLGPGPSRDSGTHRDLL